MNEIFDVLNENGEYTNEVASREDCHKKGLWHRGVVVFIVSKDSKRVLLQQRSATKKQYPNLWDITAGGHTLSQELGYQSVIRETREEIGIDLNKKDLEFIGATTSEHTQDGIVNRHFNEYFIAHCDVDLQNVVLQKEEVQDIKWFDKEEIIRRVENNFEDLTDRIGCWNHLIKYFAIMDNKNNKY